MKVPEKLIHRPAGQPVVDRTVFGVLTLLAWSLYLYLWTPLATLLLWAAGLRTSYLQLYLQANEVNGALLLQLAAIAAGCAALLIGWAEYNRVRFQGMDRRGRLADATLDDIAAALNTRLEDAAQLQSARIAVVVMDTAAVPTAVRVGRPLARPTVSAGSAPADEHLPPSSAVAPA